MKPPRTYPTPRRVVITGIGAVAPNGSGVEAYRQALRRGASGIGTISLFAPDGLQCRVAAEVKNFAAADFMSLQEARRVGRAVPLLIAATAEALGRARIGWQRLSTELPHAHTSGDARQDDCRTCLNRGGLVGLNVFVDRGVQHGGSGDPLQKCMSDECGLHTEPFTQDVRRQG